MKTALTTILLLLAATASAFADNLSSLVYSGRTRWDSVSGTLTFESDGSMPDTKEGFFWQVPAMVKRILIGEGVTVRGAFRVGLRERNNPLHIMGANRRSSVIFGTDEERWTTANSIPDREKWKYSAVSVLADAEVYISNLTSKNPRGYNLSGYANKAVLHVSQCDLLDTRKGNQNNSDGFIGAAGSSIADSFISTGDDAIKIYHDVTIRNVTIEQHRNGAPIQFGWGGETDRAKAVIENLAIYGVDERQLYNMAPISWEGGTSGSREVSITGLKVRVAGKLYDPSTKGWQPIGLFKLNPKGCRADITIVDADINGLGLGILNTSGTIRMNGKIIR